MTALLKSQIRASIIEIYGTTIVTDFPLDPSPSLPESSHSPAIHLRVHETALPFAEIQWLRQQSSLTQTREWYSVGIIGNKFLLRFVGSADFVLCMQSNSIDCYPTSSANMETLQHLLLNQVIPRLLAQRGTTALHASAIAIDGVAIAFTGDSGSGKSSLATHFCMNGASLITDDCLVVNDSHSPPKAIPGYPGIRLHEDALSHFPDSLKKSKPTAQYSSKLFLGNRHLPFSFCKQSLNLSALFQLAPSEDSSTPISITPLSKLDAAHCLTKNSFRLDFTDRNCMREEFFRLVDLSKNIPVFHLSYPFTAISSDEIRDSIIKQMALL